MAHSGDKCTRSVLLIRHMAENIVTMTSNALIDGDIKEHP